MRGDRSYDFFTRALGEIKQGRVRHFSLITIICIGRSLTTNSPKILKKKKIKKKVMLINFPDSFLNKYFVDIDLPYSSVPGSIIVITVKILDYNKNQPVQYKSKV